KNFRLSIARIESWATFIPFTCRFQDKHSGIKYRLNSRKSMGVVNIMLLYVMQAFCLRCKR
ncbi:MAG: hypothetical protein QME49_07310, partial [bacterium]|nr:hypothetical protein [bacterium]